MTNFIVLHLDDTPPDPEVGMTRLFSRDDVVFLPGLNVQTPACKPSRAGSITAQHSVRSCYANDGVWDNREIDTIAHSMRRGGVDYRFWGKYINNYGNGIESPRSYRPGSFREFWGSAGGYADPPITRDGQRIRQTGHDPDVGAAVCSQWIADAATGDTPFVFWLSFNSPHQDGTGTDEAPDRYEGTHAATPIPRRPSFQFDTNDPRWALQPQWVHDVQGVLDQTELDALHRRQWDSLMAVDDAWDTIEAALVTHGLDDDTVMILFGDNSFAHGEHGTYAKESFFRECMEIHGVVKWPGVAGRVETKLCSQIDIAATVAVESGGRFGYRPDGVSLRDLITKGRSARSELFIEGHSSRASKRFYGVMTDEWKYAVYGAGDEHLIDRVADPYELHNRAADPAYADQLQEMRALLAEVKPDEAPDLLDPWPVTSAPED